MRPEDRQADLLDHTAALLVEGTEVLTMEAVARRAGVNRALPYYHFESRDNLLVELFDRHERLFSERVDAAVDQADGIEAKITAILAAWMDDLGHHASVLAALAHITTESGVLERRQQERIIDNGIRMAEMFSRETGLGPQDAAVAAAAVMGGGQAVTAMWQAMDLPADVIATRYSAFATAGLKAMAARFAPPATDPPPAS